jgi:hypothetical protein
MGVGMKHRWEEKGEGVAGAEGKAAVLVPEELMAQGQL